MDYLEQFQAYLLSRDKSPKTIQGYGADLRQFQKWVGRSLETITPADVRWYRDHLISIGASANTISRHLASLASIGQWGETKGACLRRILPCMLSYLLPTSWVRSLTITSHVAAKS
jgi:site-specific recombinase XerD